MSWNIKGGKKNYFSRIIVFNTVVILNLDQFHCIIGFCNSSKELYNFIQFSDRNIFIRSKTLIRRRGIWSLTKSNEIKSTTYKGLCIIQEKKRNLQKLLQ